MTLSDRYVPLDRRFAGLRDADDIEDLAQRSYIGRAMLEFGFTAAKPQGPARALLH